jgi:tagatose-6-phosphate ketose/aldose isomerase
MTSSFSSLVVAARGLALLGRPGCHRAIADALADAARRLLLNAVGTLEEVARSDFRRVVYLGDCCRFGAAREAALKMLEMTEGRVTTMPETFLGLRHGPMALIDRETLVVCFLSSTPVVRAYQCDLIAEVTRKQLGARKLLFGENIPAELAVDRDVVVECPGMAALGDANVPVLDVLIGQWLAFFRCRAEGLSPDAPSTRGVISRVVESFPVHPL